MTPLGRGAIAIIDGKRRDPLAAEAFAAFQRRNKDKMPDLIRAALWQAPDVLYGTSADVDESELPIFTPEECAAIPRPPMPLGATRAALSQRGKYWEPAEGGPWYATLPIYEARESRLWTGAERLRWYWSRGYAEGDPEWVARQTEAQESGYSEHSVSVMGRYLGCAEVVTYDPAAPGKWWLRTGALDALGRDVAESSLAAGKPVRVFSTPERWRLDPLGGCCVLDWSGAWARRLLIEAKTLVGDSIEHGREMERRAARTLPKVMVVAGRP